MCTLYICSVHNYRVLSQGAKQMINVYLVEIEWFEL